jgi:hypothetical protein
MMNALLTFALAILGVTTCYALSPAERAIVGTWVEYGMDYTTYYHCHSDHSLVAVSPTGPDRKPPPVVVAKGTWRVEGNDFIMEFAPFVDSHGRERWPKRIRRSSIKDLTAKTLITEDRWRYKRAKSIEASAEPLPLP